MKISAFGITDVGKRRRLNEDYYICDVEWNIYLVADGMGGKAGGELASKMAVEVFLERVNPFLKDEDITFPFEIGENDDYFSSIIKYAMQEANSTVHQYGLSETSMRGMGTTFTVAIPYKGKLYVGHIGDTRLYRVREGEITQLSEDHTLVHQLVKEGNLSPKEARQHRKRNVITRSLGPKGKIRPDVFSEQIMIGDVYVLCSDGLHQMIEEEELFNEFLLFENKGLESIGKNLVFLANEKGGKDNITLVLFKIEVENQQENA